MSFYQFLSPSKDVEMQGFGLETTREDLFEENVWQEAIVDARDMTTTTAPSSSSVASLTGLDESSRGVGLDGALEGGAPLPPRPVVYRYYPTPAFPKMRLYFDRTEGASLKAIIRRSSLIIVSERLGDWWFVTASGYSGWANTASTSGHQGDSLHVERVHTIRRYEDWRGNNHFFCDGRVMLGSDARFFGVTNVLLLLPTLLFFTCIMSDFVHTRAGLTAFVFMALLAAFTMANLWITSLLEPGVLPRNPAHIKVQPPPGATVGDLGWKLCETCNIYRPPRSKHCTSCQNCVEGFDHHCPWTGNCVARRNYKFFFLFICSVTLYVVLVLLVCLLELVTSLKSLENENVRASLGDNLLLSLAGDIPLLVVTTFTFLTVWPLLSLCCYHIYLVWIGQTTNENIRAVYDATVNPYDHGCCLNYTDMCCHAAPASNLSRMSDVMSEDEFLRNLGPAYYPSQPRDEDKDKEKDKEKDKARGRSTSPPRGSLSSAAARALSPLSKGLSFNSLRGSTKSPGQSPAPSAAPDASTHTPLLSRSLPEPRAYDK